MKCPNCAQQIEDDAEFLPALRNDSVALRIARLHRPT